MLRHAEAKQTHRLKIGGVVAHRLLILIIVKAPRRVERGAAQSRSQSCEPPGEGIHRAERAQKGGHKRSADEGRRVFKTACAGLAGSMQRPLIEARVVLCGHGRQSRPRMHDDVCRTDSDENKRVNVSDQGNWGLGFEKRARLSS